MTVLAPLGGPWAVFAIALIDSAAFGIPLDPVVAFYVHNNPSGALMYALMGAVGSALGSTVPYLIGYKGGEAFLVKKIGRKRFDRIHGLTEKYGDLALIIPAMMPPPTPFKLLVFSAGVAEMRYLHFLLAIFAGRVARFLILSVLTILFGPQVIEITQVAIKQHLGLTLGIIAALIGLGVLGWWVRRDREREFDIEAQENASE
ncbi:MAG TPA: VTT domain-containing protein [Clostridia bacterium]|nr:VTT domain-containing protein [Clostridia bacterium]